MTDVKRLERGVTPPDFCLANQRNETVCLAALRGKPTIIYFYPKDLTPGCTTEATQFNDVLDDLVGLDWQLVGVSPDSVASHARFAERYQLRFDLLSDPERRTIEAWGAWGTKQRYGRTSLGVIRSTVLLDASGTVVEALYNVRAAGHAERVLRLVSELSAQWRKQAHGTP